MRRVRNNRLSSATWIPGRFGFVVSAAGAAHLAVQNSAPTGFHLDAPSQVPGSWNRH